jgi:hypothetical protein
MSAPSTSRDAPLIAGAAVPGPAHLADGRPCQDRFAHRLVGCDGAVIAVADGLGSATHAEQGASIAVAAATEAAAVALTTTPSALEETARAGVAAARAAIEQAATTTRSALRSLACTLIVVAIHRDSVGIAQIGDGAVIVQGDDLVLASGPGDAEYVEEVSPLTGESWQDEVRIAAHSGVRALAVFTDGVQRAALRPVAKDPHPQFFQPIFEHVRRVGDPMAAAPDLAALLAGAKLSEHSDDDKTLVIALLTDMSADPPA